MSAKKKLKGAAESGSDAPTCSESSLSCHDCLYCGPVEAKPWPECSNCGEPAKWIGTHPDAGGVPVCVQCVGGQGFKTLRLYSEILKRPMPSQNAEASRSADNQPPTKPENV